MPRRVAVAVLSLLVLAVMTACDRAGDATGPEATMAVSIVEASVTDLQRGMEEGAFTAVDLVDAHLARIEALNDELDAVIAVNPRARSEARRLDEERAGGTVRGPLHGIPVLLKDNIETAGPLPTTAGSLALAGNVTGRDAHLVGRLREAGAVILGKTNLSEWANFRSERSSSGWSAVGGQTRNPYDPARSPCGSSSGSAVAVAASMAPLAVGTETNGSIVCPSSVNGVVGIKPTVGLVSRTGIVPISHTQDTAGPMARSVADAAALLEAMMGADGADPATTVAEEASTWNLRQALENASLAGVRLGVVRSSTGYHEEVDRLFEQALEDLAAAGAVLVDGVDLTPPPTYSAAEYDVLLYEFRHDLDAYLATLPGEAGTLTLEALIRFNEEHAAEEMPWFRQEIFEKSLAKGPLTDQAYRDALALVRKAAGEDGIERALREHEVDALIAPTVGPAWTIDLVNGDHFSGGASDFAAVAGMPHVTVPMGAVHGLPVSISFFGQALSEPALLAMAHAYETATARRVPPE